MTHVMYPSASAVLKIEAVIKAVVAEHSPGIVSSDERICTLQLPFVLDVLDEKYAMKIDRSEALTLTVTELAMLVQWHLADEVHARTIDVIDRITTIDNSLLHPLTLLVDDLGIDSISMMRVGLALEDEFDIAIQDDKLHSFRTIAGLENYIRVLLDEKQ